MDPMGLPVNSRCSIARSLGVLGQKWALLILREALRGRTRFADFHRIGVPTEALSTRLGELVDAGLLERRPYRLDGERTRDEYVLTDAGRDVVLVMGALSAWSDAHQPLEGGPYVAYRRASDGVRVRVRFVDDAGVAVDPSEVVLSRPAERASE
ncbi:helix-turn-helix domain-containing protein [Raineyella sp. LH-20]|uniref:winged helix-turn-helix transcriptional regulator n=1 Tax=Raineyella sp. LH-20 TaxID=3081204 RepID=UPI002955B2A4|nr:helix-turn-helix domain-containing protein [Raineyella sp. LH-20]WOP19347.1 helix-turn-helix domain-containing protein [Raineyella sp. LH-20]